MARQRRRTRRIPDRETDRILRLVADTTLRLRRASRWTQRQLGDRAGVAQSEVSDVEHARLPDLPIGTVVRLMTSLGGEVGLAIDAPGLLEAGRQREPVHARMSAYVSRRLRDAGWNVSVEAEILTGAARGWIDILAYLPSAGTLLVIELKTELVDVGALQRQVGWYEREARGAARRLGWIVRDVVTCVVLLDSEAVASALRFNRATFDQEFPLRARELEVILREGAADRAPTSVQRGVVMIDPRSRRVSWLRPTAIDRRRSAAAYVDYADFMARRRE